MSSKYGTLSAAEIARLKPASRELRRDLRELLQAQKPTKTRKGKYRKKAQRAAIARDIAAAREKEERHKQEAREFHERNRNKRKVISKTRDRGRKREKDHKTRDKLRWWAP